MYCDNDQCDAPEITVIVMSDDTQSTQSRTDVRILQRFAPVADRPSSSLVEESVTGSLALCRRRGAGQRSACSAASDRVCLHPAMSRETRAGFAYLSRRGSKATTSSTT